jgi:hypothetical protein
VRPQEGTINRSARHNVLLGIQQCVGNLHQDSHPLSKTVAHRNPCHTFRHDAMATHDSCWRGCTLNAIRKKVAALGV